MKKETKTNKTTDVLRWILLAPFVIATWYMVLFIVAPIPHLIYSLGWVKILEYLETPLFIIGGFVLPCIAVYFVAKYIAPKYKNIVGWSAVVFCALWELFLIFGLTHLAY